MFGLGQLRGLFLLALLAALPASAQTATAQPPSPPVPQAATQPANPPPTPEQLGDALVVHQRYQAAIAAYGKDPQPSAMVWNKLGIAYQMMFNLKDATRCYKSSLKIDPRNAQVMNNLATVYDSLKQYGQAERMYRKALKIDPQSALVLKNLGSNLLSQHQYKRGWAVYQQALAIDPHIFEDHTSLRVENPASAKDRGAMNYYMARSCARSGLTDCAIQYLRMAISEGFTDPKKLAADTDFTSLHDLPAFQQLIAAPSAR